MSKNRPNKRRRLERLKRIKGNQETVSANGRARLAGDLPGPNRRVLGQVITTNPTSAKLGAKAARFRDPAGGGFSARIIDRPGACDTPWQVLNPAGHVVASYPSQREAKASLPAWSYLAKGMRLRVRRRPGNV
jgi:hypothetical protein